jgi:hypothetical protein
MTDRKSTGFCILTLTQSSIRTFGDNSRDDFRVVSGILRLSTKYLIEGLRAKALAHLSIAWPSTLKDWDSREETARSWELDNSSHGGLFYPSPIVSSQL